MKKVLDKILKLRPVTYKWNTKNKFEKKFEEKSIQHGFIAQEVEKVLPELITTDVDSLKSIQYTSIISMLVKSIQELNTKIDKLNLEVKKLKKV